MLKAGIITQGIMCEVLKRHIILKGKEEEYAKIESATRLTPYREIMYRVSYADLNELLNILGITLVELFAECGIKIKLTEQDITIIWKINNLRDEEIAKLIDFIDSGNLSKAWWKTEQLSTPTERMRALISRRIPQTQRRVVTPAMSMDMIDAWCKTPKSLHVESMPLAASTLDTSLRWLMCMSADSVVLCNRAIADDLFDKFKLLPQSQRGVIEETVDMLLREGTEV